MTANHNIIAIADSSCKEGICEHGTNDLDFRYDPAIGGEIFVYTASPSASLTIYGTGHLGYSFADLGFSTQLPQRPALRNVVLNSCLMTAHHDKYHDADQIAEAVQRYIMICLIQRKEKVAFTDSFSVYGSAIASFPTKMESSQFRNTKVK